MPEAPIIPGFTDAAALLAEAEHLRAALPANAQVREDIEVIRFLCRLAEEGYAVDLAETRWCFRRLYAVLAAETTRRGEPEKHG